MKKYSVLAATFALLFLLSFSVYADDNAIDGNGTPTGHGAIGKGYYYGREYLYKVSVYVGRTENAYHTDTDMSRFQMLGNSFYLKPNYLAIPANTVFVVGNKVQHISDMELHISRTVPIKSVPNLPPPPVVCGGNIQSVKAYFGDTATLSNQISEIASMQGKTVTQIIESMTFTIGGTSGHFPATDILPQEINGSYANKVPWLISYEPVVIAHLRDGKTVLALTATEYAMAQKAGYFNFFSQEPDGQHIALMTHALLPSSIMLDESWFGYDAPEPPAARVKWSNDAIIDYGGWGMRLLAANGHVTPNNTSYDAEYRVDTDVITSFEVKSSGRVTPDDPAYITMTVDGIDGARTTKTVVMPGDSTQLVWMKWHTPSQAMNKSVVATISGNAGVSFSQGGRQRAADFSITRLTDNPPPDPKFNDVKPAGFTIQPPPVEADVSTASWTVWKCRWVPDWKYEVDWDWIEDATNLIDGGHWVDNGDWVDRGDWSYDLERFHASLDAAVTITPDDQCPTAEKVFEPDINHVQELVWKLGSAYGFSIQVLPNMRYNCSSNDVSDAQNAITRFPEYEYKTYWRALEKILEETHLLLSFLLIHIHNMATGCISLLFGIPMASMSQ